MYWTTKYSGKYVSVRYLLSVINLHLLLSPMHCNDFAWNLLALVINLWVTVNKLNFNSLSLLTWSNSLVTVELSQLVRFYSYYYNKVNMLLLRSLLVVFILIKLLPGMPLFQSVDRIFLVHVLCYLFAVTTGHNTVPCALLGLQVWTKFWRTESWWKPIRTLALLVIVLVLQQFKQIIELSKIHEANAAMYVSQANCVCI